MTSDDLGRRDQVWHPYTQMFNEPPPLAIVRGEGAFLYTDDGRRILDGVSSWWVNIHGHSHPRLNEALARQARALEHVIFAGCTHRPAVELAERLVELLPAGLTRVFYSDNGSTAVEVALKLAWQYWQNRNDAERQTFVALDRAYHGDTIGAMSVSAASSFTAPFSSLMFPVTRVHEPYCFRVPPEPRARELCDRLPVESRSGAVASGVARGRRAGRADAARGGRDDRLANRVLGRRSPGCAMSTAP